MYLIKQQYKALLVVLFFVPVSAQADAWSCSHGNDVREVSIERSTPSPVPCHVIYKKPTEGIEDQVLWAANHDDSYCDVKANGLIATLESAGWVCTETISDNTQ